MNNKLFPITVDGVNYLIDKKTDVVDNDIAVVNGG